MNAHNFTIGSQINSTQIPLTLDDLRHYAPSAFATEARESRSARYTYIPTSEVIAGLMREGFQPFKATQSRSRIEGKFEFTKHMIRFRHPDSFAAIQRVGDSVPAGPKQDLWHTLNVVQENVVKGGLHGTQWTTDEKTGRRTHRCVTTREVKGIDQDVKLNRALWMLAERMAELKAA